jgi:alpha-D-xyloside xylohydrolase
MPYIFTQSVIAHKTGIPVMRPMMMEFENDPVCDSLEMQYMLGDSLLVAPIFSDDSQVSFYLPQGTFTDFLTGKQVEGGRYVSEKHSYMSIPLYVKENSVIPTGSIDTKPDYNYCDGVTLNVFTLSVSITCQVANMQGEIAMESAFEVSGDTIKVTTSGKNGNYRILLWNVDSVSEVAGANAEKTDKGILLTDCKETVSYKIG